MGDVNKYTTPLQVVILQTCHLATRHEQLTTIIIVVLDAGSGSNSSSRVEGLILVILILEVLHVLKSFSL